MTSPPEPYVGLSQNLVDDIREIWRFKLLKLFRYAIQDDRTVARWPL